MNCFTVNLAKFDYSNVPIIATSIIQTQYELKENTNTTNRFASLLLLFTLVLSTYTKLWNTNHNNIMYSQLSKVRERKKHTIWAPDPMSYRIILWKWWHFFGKHRHLNWQLNYIFQKKIASNPFFDFFAHSNFWSLGTMNEEKTMCINVHAKIRNW